MPTDRERAVEFIERHNFNRGAGRTFAEIALRNEFAAIRAECAEVAETEREAALSTADAALGDIAKLQAKLVALRGLSEKWRKTALVKRQSRYYGWTLGVSDVRFDEGKGAGLDEAADELTELLEASDG